MPFTKFNNKNIHFTDTGQGKVIVLLHGFMESQHIWNLFVNELSGDFRVIAVDLPGHGRSEVLSEIHTMEIMADMVHSLLNKLGTGKCIMIGHSMGGFITLAFAEKYPEMLKGFSLFHSHAFEDSDEGKTNRDRSIEFVQKDKTNFLTMFIPALFSEDSQVKHKIMIEKLISEAKKMTREGIIASLAGMKLRPSRTHVLEKTKVPVLFIIGLLDIRFPVDRAWEMIGLPKHSQVLILRDVAHMGYIEAPEATLTAVRQFAESL